MTPWSFGATVHLLDPSSRFDQLARPTLCGFALFQRGMVNHTPETIAPTCIRCIRVAKRAVESTPRAVDEGSRPYDWRLDGL